MSRSAIHGRRIHIAGSISTDPAIASADDVEGAQKLVAGLVRALMRKGANFVVPVDAEPRRADGQPVCFDWIVWQTIRDTLALRPPETPGPLAVGVLHHKTEEQIPADRVALWDELRNGPNVMLESAAHWNMASKRMEAQARYGDILVTLGGTEGVTYLANLYHDAGRPVVPLDLALVREGEGSRRLNAWGMASSNSGKLFQLADGGNAHDWMNRIRFPARRTVEQRIETLVDLIESLERPRAFAVRLLNDEHEEYAAVQDFFDNVVRPVVEDDLGYRLTIIDGRQAYEHAHVDQEIFAKLHRSALTIADLTGSRPNCFLELGYSLGRTLPTVVTARKGFDTPFDIMTFAGHHWKTSGEATERRRAFREHIEAVRNRPPLVASEGLLQ
jgi:hypothetical protein